MQADFSPDPEGSGSSTDLTAENLKELVEFTFSLPLDRPETVASHRREVVDTFGHMLDFTKSKGTEIAWESFGDCLMRHGPNDRLYQPTRIYSELRDLEQQLVEKLWNDRSYLHPNAVCYAARSYGFIKGSSGSPSERQEGHRILETGLQIGLTQKEALSQEGLFELSGVAFLLARSEEKEGQFALAQKSILIALALSPNEEVAQKTFIGNSMAWCYTLSSKDSEKETIAEEMYRRTAAACELPTYGLPLLHRAINAGIGMLRGRQDFFTQISDVVDEGKELSIEGGKANTAHFQMAEMLAKAIKARQEGQPMADHEVAKLSQSAQKHLTNPNDKPLALLAETLAMALSGHVDCARSLSASCKNTEVKDAGAIKLADEIIELCGA